ncbi:hypothetical protein ACFE04_005116 [Oxalis oulophora]
MAFSKSLSFSSLILVSFIFTFTNAANFKVVNNCPFTVWAAAIPGGGSRLKRGQTWSIHIPHTLAEFSLGQENNFDAYSISLINGFNVGMDYSPKSNQCRGIRCNADIKGMCPKQLKTPGGCNNPCTAFGRCDPSDQTRFFKLKCPHAYSYPNDDATSSFSCPGGTNYRVVFCP